MSCTKVMLSKYKMHLKKLFRNFIFKKNTFLSVIIFPHLELGNSKMQMLSSHNAHVFLGALY